MLYEDNRYRGFLINVEMHEGRFRPSYHDCMQHKQDSWQKMTKCIADTQEEALKLAHKQLDDMIDFESDAVVARFEKSWKAQK